MEIDDIQALVGKWPGVTFDIKWEYILTCLVGGKLFCNINLNTVPTVCSIKVTPDEYHQLIGRDGFNPAPYFARYHWVQLTQLSLWSRHEWENYLKESYELTLSKLPKKTQISIKQID